MGHTQMHTNIENDLDSLTQKVGINGDTNTASLDYIVTHNTTNIASNTTAISNLQGGWNSVSDTWTYASATTITVPSDATQKYSVGDRLKITQTTVKYFYIVGVSATTLTITGGSDYTLTNAAISNIYYSKASTPTGFPQWFNFSTTFTGVSSQPTFVSRFNIVGRQCTVVTKRSSNSTSNATTMTLGAPVTSANVANMGWTGFGSGVDNSAALTNSLLAAISANTTTINIYKDMSAAAFTATGSKGADIVITYEI